jgi:uncharacterized protein (UPF0261 family)
MRTAWTSQASWPQRPRRGRHRHGGSGGGVFVGQLVSEGGKVQGVISLGGGGGTAIGSAAMRALPVGFPKVMVSTLAAGNVAPYVGTKDIVMFPSIVDVSGMNRISRVLLARAPVPSAAWSRRRCPGR